MPARTKPKGKTISPSRKALYGLTLDVSSLVLTTLRDAARAAPVPYLMQAATLALGILGTIQDMKDCQEGFERLASDACGLVYAIPGIRTNTTVMMSKELLPDVEKLLETLQSIQAFCQKELKRNTINRMIHHGSDRGKILEYREALRQSLDVFGLQSTISIRENIERIIQKQDDLVIHLQQQRTRDSNLSQLLTEVLGQSRAENPPDQRHTATPASPPSHPLSPAESVTSLPSPTPPSNNPFRSAHLPAPFHANTLRRLPHLERPWDVASSSSPHYHINGDFKSKDNSRHTENINSNNTTITNTSGSNNDSSIKILGLWS